jgi:RHS repeat-associated protein
LNPIHALEDLGGAIEEGVEELGDAVVYVGDKVYDVTKEFAAALKEATEFVLNFADDALEKVIRLTGMYWPEADEGKLHEAASAYRTMADAIDGARGATTSTAHSVTENNSGSSIDNLKAFWTQYDGGGDVGWLAQTAKSCRANAKALDDFADAIGEVKRKLKIEVLAVAATILAGAALAIGTAGISGAAASAAATGLVSLAAGVGVTLSATVATILAGALVFGTAGALMAVTLDLAVTQPILLAGGVQEGMDLSPSHLLSVAETGAVAGAVGGGFSGGLPTALAKIEAVAPGLVSVTQKVPAALMSLPGQMTLGAGTTAVVDVVTGKPITLADLAFGAAGGAAGYGGNKVAPSALPKGPHGVVDPAEANVTARPQEAETWGGDPVEVVAGKMVLPQTDVVLPGALPWVMTRQHLSSYRYGRWFGRSWASWLDQHLELSGDQVVFTGADGLVLRYPVPEAGSRIFPVAGPMLALAWDGTPGGAFAVADQRTGVIRYFAAPTDGSAVFGREGLVMPLVAVADRNGNQINIVHDAVGTPTEIRHSGGYRIGIETAHDRVTCLRLLDTDPETHMHDPEHRDGVVLVRYGYDVHGDLTEVVNSSGEPLRFTYDTQGRVTSWTDRVGKSASYTYDESGRCTRTTGADGVLDTRFEYDTAARTTTSTDSLGESTVYRYNAAYQITAETDPLGHTTCKEWDDRNRLLSVTDPLGRTTRFAYDELGSVTGVVHADGAQSTTRYDERGKPLLFTGPDGASWRYEYDARGNRTAVVDPLGQRTGIERDQYGRAIVVADALGGVRRIAYNAAGLPIQVTDPLGARTRILRDGFGRPVEVTDALGGTTRSGWTLEGNAAWRERGELRDEWSYDAEGNLASHRDAAGNRTFHEVTHFDRPSARIDAAGARYEFEYDTELRLTGVRNPHGQSWTYAYDAAGRLVAERDFNNRELTYDLDATGRLVTKVNGAGEPLEFERDLQGRVIRKTHLDTGRTTTYAYDAGGRLVLTANADVELAFERDVIGRVTAEVSNGRRLTSAYDALGRRIRRETPSGHVSTWTYDLAGRPVTLDSAGHAIEFTHDLLGRETARTFGDHIALTQEWDSAGRLGAQTLQQGESSDPITAALSPERGRQVIRRSRYDYRADGFLIGVDDSRTGRKRFDLDPVGRVTAVNAESWTECYAYDALGNLTHGQWPSAGDADADDTQGDREVAGTLIRRAGRTRFQYDAQGRLVRKFRKTLSGKTRSWVFTWDAEDRLTGVSNPLGENWRYIYDPLGRRTAKQRDADGLQRAEDRVEFAWDGACLTEEQAELATTWEFQTSHRWRPLAQSRRAPASDRRPEVAEFSVILTDPVGATLETVDVHGEVRGHGEANLWGQPAGSPAVRDGDYPLRFPGQYRDAESGLSQNYLRHYDPATGGYLSPDPVGLVAADNQHAYVANPTGSSDPLGLAPYNPDDPPLFRGTTEDFDGSPGTQRSGVTPTSTDPGVATIFGTHAESYGDSVVRIALPGDVTGVPRYEGYIPAEAEVGLEMSASDFADAASVKIPTSTAREILQDMGINIPLRIGIEDLSPTLRETPKLTPDQIQRFIDEANTRGR